MVFQCPHGTIYHMLKDGMMYKDLGCNHFDRRSTDKQKQLGAHVIVSEIGIDMSRFPSHAHLISWAGICPRNDESAGKRRSNRFNAG